jgi:ATP-dependent Clp protease protease subunit
MKFFWMFLIGIFMMLPACASKAADITLTPDNTIVLKGKIDYLTVAEVSDKILTHPEDELYLFIDSPGGQIFPGLQLANILENTDKEVTCIANIAASMAFIIMQHCDERLVMDHSIMMQHVASYGLRGQEPNNYSFSKFFRKMVKQIIKKQADKIGMSYGEFYRKTRNDWWLFGEDIVSWNVADEIVTVACSSAMSKVTIKKSIRSLFWNIEVTYSGCPLISAPIKIGSKRLGSGQDERAGQELTAILEEVDARQGLNKWIETQRNPRDVLDRVRRTNY